ncbi:hypothetical protein E2C01_044287 [Portunus trituberculatus]|uniref:Uncharacterized protein n=1 Tax=Portunus trituberculatus TaxID=210409 RepID=A0A5B7G009_PORTR|nr:hypothetical protein [Portunus trituberculatus]
MWQNFAPVPYGTLRSPPRLCGVPVNLEDAQALVEVWVQHPPAASPLLCVAAQDIQERAVQSRWGRTCALYSNSFPFLSRKPATLLRAEIL